MDFPTVWKVEIVRHAAARRFIARRRGDIVRLTVQAGATGADIADALRRLAPRLSSKRFLSRKLFADGMLIEQPGIRVRICLSGDADRPVLRGNAADAVLLVPQDMSLESHEAQAALTGLLMRLARNRAAVLVEQAGSVAARIGAAPSAWRIGRGTRTLGCCNGRREITLSAALMFVPPHLREYVMCHELAHLSEMNHSPRFHALCDSYCGGREGALAAELRAYQWPLLR